MEHNTFKHYVHAIFSETLMVFLALLVIPILILQFSELTPVQTLILTVVDWIIYAAFFLEFVLKVGIAERKLGYIKENSLDSVISLIIILSPLLALSTAYFVGAPLLRLIRISKVVRLTGVVEKTSVSWRKVSLRSYGILPAIIGAGFVVSFFRPHLLYTTDEVMWMNTFLQVSGSIYAIVAAFVIYHVWNQFTSLDEQIRSEATSLRNAYILSLRMGQKKVSETLRANILNYIKFVIDAYWKSDEVKIVDKKDIFATLFTAVEKAKVATQKDAVLLDNINEELRDASENRSSIVSLASSHTPNILWALLVFLSSMIVFGFWIANINSHILATIAITLTSAAIALITVVIYDIDYPFSGGFWVLSPDPYFELEQFVKETNS